MARWSRWKDAPDWIESLDDALVDPMPISQKRERYEAEPTPTAARVLARVATSVGDLREAARYYGDLMELDPENRFDYGIRAVLWLREGLADGRLDLDALEGFSRPLVEDGTGTAEEYMTLAIVLAENLAEAHPDRFSPYATAAIESNAEATDPMQRLRRSYLQMLVALHRDHDAETALVHRRELLSDGYEEDTRELNGFAWWCLQNRVNLEEGERFARKAVELERDPRLRANIMDTVARFCDLRGDHEDALQWMEQAAQLDPQQPYYRQQADRFAELVAAEGD